MVKKSIVLGSVVIAVLFVAVWHTLAANFTKNFPIVGNYIISLPGTVSAPPMANAEDLFGAIGSAVRVGKWDTLTDTFREWNGSACINPETGAGGCGSSCFCINTGNGLGFLVEVSAPSSLNITGLDTPTSIALLEPGVNSLTGAHYVSIPLDTPLSLATEVRSQVIAQGGAHPMLVSRLNTTTNSLVTYAGINSANDFSLTPGEGYVLVVNTGSTYIPSANPLIVDSGSGNYTITGDVTTSTFAWELVGPACMNLATPSGVTQNDIATNLATAINVDCCPGSACCPNCATATNNTVNIVPPHTLNIGSTAAACPVTTFGCAFNPTIVLDEVPLLVTLDSFTAQPYPEGIQLRWRTLSEEDNVGFRVLRSTRDTFGKTGEPQPIHDGIIPARGTALSGAEYELLDADIGRIGGAIVYWLEDVDVYGRATRHEPVMVNFGRNYRTAPGQSR